MARTAGVRNKQSESKKQVWISAEKLINIDPVDLKINDGKVVKASDKILQPHTFAVAISSFRDLQLLGYVPRALAQKEVYKSIQSDDQRASAISDQQLERGARPCECAGNEKATVKFGTERPDQRWRSIRSQSQHNLAQLLCAHYKIPFQPNHLIAGNVWNWVTRLEHKKRIILPAFVLKDIVIGPLSTFRLNDAVQQIVLARNIYIHSTGKFITGSGYTRIWANSVQKTGYLFTGKLNAIPWKLTQLRR